MKNSCGPIQINGSARFLGNDFECVTGHNKACVLRLLANGWRNVAGNKMLKFDCVDDPSWSDFYRLLMGKHAGKLRKQSLGLSNRKGGVHRGLDVHVRPQLLTAARPLLIVTRVR